MKAKIKWLLLISLMVVLSGCMYPKDRLAQNQLPLTDQLSLVQKGINEFFAEQQILPILTKEMSTPIYEKYVIDFTKMVPKYIPFVPGAAFEQGGTYLFVLTDVEKNPTVKLLDLRIAERVSDVQSRVTYFYQKNKALPVEGVVKSGYFTINFKQIGLSKNEVVESPYTGQALPIIMNSKGVVGVDYLQDIEQVLKNNHLQISDNRELREVLPANSSYVPVKSFPYRMEKGKPSLIFEQ